MQPEKWYVLYTAPRGEKMVEKRLAEDGVEVFLPLYKAKRKWSDRIKIVEMPLFSSYIFVKCRAVELSRVAATKGVVRVVYYVGKPAVVRESEIDAIKEFVAIADNNRLLSVGETATIVDGPFEKRSGKVVKLTSKYYYLYLEELGIVVCVEKLKTEKL